MATLLDAHTRRVLQRFVRDYVATYQARRSRQSLSRLERAFKNAKTHQRFNSPQREDDAKQPSTVTPKKEELAEKRRQLDHKYRASCVRPPSPSCDSEMTVLKSSCGNVGDPEENDVQSDSREDSDATEQSHQHVTFEVVVQHLHAQLEQARDDITAKDQRIRTLEALVASLEMENESLKDTLRRSLKPTPASLGLDSNQVFTN